MRASLLIFVVIICLAGGACRRLSAEARSERPAKPKAEPTWNDSDHNGLPDRLQLASYEDQQAFRTWFTSISELQFYHLSDAWNAEQRDCAGLVRFAVREALRKHDKLWYRKMGAVYDPVSPDVASVNLDKGPIGEKIFRSGPGTFRESDLSDGTLTEFADARTLKDFNTDFISRDRKQAQPGDLLFFRQQWVQKFPYHVMIFLGPARVSSENVDDWVVYHTGSSATDDGTVKKVRLSVLDHHPDPRWRPLLSNRNFLGFYRLKILK